jgi:hypothetical protein
MKFSEWLFHVLKRVAATNYAHLTSSINDDGVFEAELVGVVDNQVATIASITENATKAELAEFERKIDLLQSAVQAQDAEDEANEARIREILNKLTREERMLIDRPLPEEMIPDSESDEGVEY